MTQSGITDPENDPRAQALIHDIEHFIDELYARTEDTGTVQSICDGERPNGTDLSQEPERFVVEHFIRPVLDTLGYDYRPQPRGLSGLGDNTPDFLLTNVAEPIILGEVKPPGDPTRARSESFEYLTEIESRMAVGISTDGLAWYLHWAVGGNRPTCEKESHLGTPINRIRKERLGSGAHHRDRRELRKELYPFVEAFSRRGIMDQAAKFNSKLESY